MIDIDKAIAENEQRIDEASTFQVAKQIAWRSHNGNPTTHIHNALSGETWVNKKGLWTSIGWDK